MSHTIVIRPRPLTDTTVTLMGGMGDGMKHPGTDYQVTARDRRVMEKSRYARTKARSWVRNPKR